MGWVKLDDEFPDHPKIDDLPDGAFRLHIAGLCYCARKLTDGVIPLSKLNRLVPRYKPAQVDELQAHGVWHRPGHTCDTCDQPPAGHAVIHDYLEWNRSADVEHERRRKRAEAGRIGGQRSGITRRSKSEANTEANASAFAEANGKQTRTPSPSPSPSPYRSPSSSDVDTSTSSSSAGTDDDTTRTTIDAAFRVLADRNLERRNHSPRGQCDPITTTPRRRAWIAEDITRSHQILGRLAASYLADDPTLTAGELADRIDNPQEATL